MEKEEKVKERKVASEDSGWSKSKKLDFLIDLCAGIKRSKTELLVASWMAWGATLKEIDALIAELERDGRIIIVGYVDAYTKSESSAPVRSSYIR